MSEQRSKIYEPTQDEIAAACALIRATWTEDERLKRLRADWRCLADNRTPVRLVRSVERR